MVRKFKQTKIHTSTQHTHIYSKDRGDQEKGGEQERNTSYLKLIKQNTRNKTDITDKVKKIPIIPKP